MHLQQETYIHHKPIPCPTQSQNQDILHVVAGIDEAGRGPVLGPMVYGIAYHPVGQQDAFSKIGFADSKQLTPQIRDKFFETLENSNDIGFCVTPISAREISSRMFLQQNMELMEKDIYRANCSGAGSLNDIAFIATCDIIREVLKDGTIAIDELYVDTLGPPEKHQARLKTAFPSIPKIIVAKKADSLYPIVSAASICAKVTRDAILMGWKEPTIEKHMKNLVIGSGYPSDQTTVRWLKDNLNKVFGQSLLVRYSWSTTVNALTNAEKTGDLVPVTVLDPVAVKKAAEECANRKDKKRIDSNPLFPYKKSTKRKTRLTNRLLANVRSVRSA